MAKNERIPGSDQAWDSGALGEDPKFAKVFEGNIEDEIDEALAMRPISIRLPKTLIEQFKVLADLNGLGYQPLMRRALIRFAEGEIKCLRNLMVAERRRLAEEDDDDDDPQKVAHG